MKLQRNLLLVGLISLLAVACSRRADTPAQDTALLERIVRVQPSEKQFLNDVRGFYQAVADRNWQYTYYARTNAFKESVPLKVYLASVNEAGENISKFSYAVLAHDEFVVLGERRKRLIMKFLHNSQRIEYSVVWWAYEEGQWRCEEVGFRNIALFQTFGPPR
jgi:hypothetical protein